jgi:LacI family transcriptional regulator
LRYRTIAFLTGYADSPDSLARHESLRAEAAKTGARLLAGSHWQGNYYAAGSSRAIARLIADGKALPSAIACANDQTALGVICAVAKYGVEVPGDVAVTGFDDIPMTPHTPGTKPLYVSRSRRSALPPSNSFIR